MADSLTHEWTRSNLLGRDTTPEMIRRYSNEGQVTDSTPGTFITHAMDDPAVKVENSLYFEAALVQPTFRCRCSSMPTAGMGQY